MLHIDSGSQPHAPGAAAAEDLVLSVYPASRWSSRSAARSTSSPPGLRDELLRVIRRHGADLALNLTGVTFMDCAGIDGLLATRRRARLEQGSVRVTGASPRVRRMIGLLGLDRVFALG